MTTMRSSTRLRSQKKPQYFESLHDLPQLSDEDAFQPRSKRQKTIKPSSGYRRNRRGSLKLVTEMPLEIIQEIFYHLEFADIFHLSRANKFLREMLLSKTFIWKTAFENSSRTRLPLPANDLSYVRYASLIYGRHCHYCAQPDANYVYAPCYIRMCRSCINAKTFQLGWDDVSGEIRPLISVWLVRLPDPAPKWKQFVSLIDEYKSVKEQLTKLKDDVPRREAFIEARKETVTERRLFAALVDNWFDSSKEHRKSELNDIRTRRREAIIEKLKAGGWTEELEEMGPRGAKAIPGASEPRELTEKIWSKIQDRVYEFMEDQRTARLKRIRNKNLSERLLQFQSVVTKHMEPQSIKAILPSAADLSVEEPIKSIIFSSSDTPFSEVELSTLDGFIKETSDKWVEVRNDELRKLLPQGSRNLDLAKTFFRCKWCLEPIGYPRILKHACLITAHNEIFNDDELYSTQMTIKPWNFGGGQVTYDKDATAYAQDIILVCGERPANITTAQMDTRHYRLECLRCTRTANGHSRLFFDWKSAVYHDIDQHYDKTWKGARWKLASEIDFKIIQARESKRREISQRIRSVGCKRCGSIFPFHSAPIHLLNRHQVPFENWKKEAFVPLDTPVYEAYLPVKI